MTISEMKVGDIFLMNGELVDGLPVKFECELTEIVKGMDKYIVQAGSVSIVVKGDYKAFEK